MGRMTSSSDMSQKSHRAVTFTRNLNRVRQNSWERRAQLEATLQTDESADSNEAAEAFPMV